MAAALPFGAKCQDTTDFRQWKELRQHQYEHYVDSVRDDYRRFLEQVWEEYDLYNSEHRQGTDKPQMQPHTDNADPSDEELTMSPIVAEMFQTKLSSDTTSMVGAYAEHIHFPFYAKELTMHVPQGMTKLHLDGIRERQVSRFWSHLDEQKVQQLVGQIRNHQQNLSLNDWGVVDLVGRFSAKVYPADENAQVALTVYLLNKLSYDARVGRMDDHLVMMATTRQQVYERPFVLLDQKKYYLLRTQMPDTRHPRISTYSMQHPGSTTPIDLGLRYAPRLGVSPAKKTTYQYGFEGKMLTVPVNKAMIDFYAVYPQTDLPVYANAAVGETLTATMDKVFASLLRGKDDVASVALLLRYVQDGFRYEVDRAQFGREKTFFCEENFYYMANDCEDRAVLFSYLVRQLVGLDVVLLQYEDHVATAVCFGDAKVRGDHYQYQGKTYVVCDPTTKGAKVGQLVKKYRRQAPKMIITKNII